MVGRLSLRRAPLPVRFAALLALLAGPAAAQLEFRSIDGSGNNLDHLSWGSAGAELARRGAPDYADGIGSPAGQDRPGAREVSNAVCDQSKELFDDSRASDMLWQWGQFLDHDIDLTPGAEPPEALHVPVPAGDVFFDPLATGTVLIPMFRSAHADASGVREQLNAITAFIDASNVYGSDPVRAEALRDPLDRARLAESPGRLLPFNEAGLPNAGGTGPELFLAGDLRANEQVGLTAMHTLFVREHNGIVAWLRRGSGPQDAETLYQTARAIVGAEMQAITYREFLPVLLGPDALPDYTGYDASVDPTISNEFSTAAYRLGHSMLSARILRLRPGGRPIPQGHLRLRDAFFDPDQLINGGGIEPILRGLAAQRAQRIDVFVVDEVRNFLFGQPGSGGLDLASLNVQRGRDHGLASYNRMRMDFGLAPRSTFAEVCSDPLVQARLASVYATVDDVDAWVGGLAEDPVRGALVGELFQRVLVDQFRRLRDGDRFWYRNHLPARLVRRIELSSLEKIMRRNGVVGPIPHGDPFRVR